MTMIKNFEHPKSHRFTLSICSLLFVVSALRKLFEDENFINLLRAESLDTLPAYLSTQIHGEGA